MPTFLRYAEVIDLLQTQAGLRTREARQCVKSAQIPPHPHGLHSRRLWLKQQVLDFCAALRNHGGALGKVERSDS
jgi:hypothetical protein